MLERILVVTATVSGQLRKSPRRSTYLRRAFANEEDLAEFALAERHSVLLFVAFRPWRIL